MEYLKYKFTKEQAPGIIAAYLVQIEKTPDYHEGKYNKAKDREFLKGMASRHEQGSPFTEGQLRGLGGTAARIDDVLEGKEIRVPRKKRRKDEVELLRHKPQGFDRAIKDQHFWQNMYMAEHHKEWEISHALVLGDVFLHSFQDRDYVDRSVTMIAAATTLGEKTVRRVIKQLDADEVFRYEKTGGFFWDKKSGKSGKYRACGRFSELMSRAEAKFGNPHRVTEGKEQTAEVTAESVAKVEPKPRVLPEYDEIEGEEPIHARSTGDRSRNATPGHHDDRVTENTPGQQVTGHKIISASMSEAGTEAERASRAQPAFPLRGLRGVARSASDRGREPERKEEEEPERDPGRFDGQQWEVDPGQQGTAPDLQEDVSGQPAAARPVPLPTARPSAPRHRGPKRRDPNRGDAKQWVPWMERFHSDWDDWGDAENDPRDKRFCYERIAKEHKMDSEMVTASIERFYTEVRDTPFPGTDRALSDLRGWLRIERKRRYHIKEPGYQTSEPVSPATARHLAMVEQFNRNKRE